MSLPFQESWKESWYYDNTMTQDWSTSSFEMCGFDIDPSLAGKPYTSQQFNGITSYLAEQEKPYYQTVAPDFTVEGAAPWPVSGQDRDHPCDPSSPEGSVGSDLSSMLDTDNFMPTPSPHSHMLSRTSSVFSSGPSGFSRVNSGSSTCMDNHMLAPALQGGLVGFYQTFTSNLADIQGSPDPEMFKTEDDHYEDFDGIKVDSHLSRLLPMTQHPTCATQYHTYSGNRTLHGSSAHTPQNTIKSEDDYDESSDIEYAEAGDNESDADYRPSGARRTTRRAMPRRRTVSDVPKPSRITKSKAPPRRTSTNGSYKAPAQSTDEHRHPCIFSFAGCQSMWKTKNEWKRHAMTQHLVLESYHCKLCKKENGDNGKGKGKIGKNIAWAKVGGVEGQVFNRKDLFTQHVKRMHEPTAYRACSKGGANGQVKKDYEEWLKTQQEKAHFCTGRQAPNNTTCPMRGCNSTFTGGKGWDARLEHIWKHFDQNECNANSDLGEGGLKEWAVANGVIENIDGRLLLKECITEDKVGNEEDAIGEDE